MHLLLEHNHFILSHNYVNLSSLNCAFIPSSIPNLSLSYSLIPSFSLSQLIDFQ